jgi:hypothetical protein
MRHFFILTITCLLITSCASIGPLYPEASKTIPRLIPDLARVYFLRTNKHSLYLGRNAAVKIGENNGGACPKGSFFYRDLSPGKYIIKTDMWDLPGSCKLVLNAKAGCVYYFEITPRMKSYTTFLTTGFLGNAIEASAQDCSGAFAIVPIPEEEAINKLSKLGIVEYNEPKKFNICREQ